MLLAKALRDRVDDPLKAKDLESIWIDVKIGASSNRVLTRARPGV